MSAIKFDIQKFDGVTNFSRWQIRMNYSYPERVEESTTREGEKPQDMKEETW